MTTLRYRSNVCVGALAIGECTVHRCGDSSGKTWWMLWFYVNRDDNGQPLDAGVPFNPNGVADPNGPGGKTWGLTRSGPNEWQVAPSINVLGSKAVHPGEHDVEPSMWHQTPKIVDVPDGELWQTSA